MTKTPQRQLPGRRRGTVHEGDVLLAGGLERDAEMVGWGLLVVKPPGVGAFKVIAELARPVLRDHSVVVAAPRIRWLGR